MKSITLSATDTTYVALQKAGGLHRERFKIGRPVAGPVTVPVLQVSLHDFGLCIPTVTSDFSAPPKSQ